MKTILHYSLVLALTGGAATAALAITYRATAPAVAAGEQHAQATALTEIFFTGYAKVEKKSGAAGDYYAVFLREENAEPDYFAALGKGVGYNKSVPVELLVGFVNPRKKNVPLPGVEPAAAPKNPAAPVCVGWKVIKSQETPGLGENAKAQRAAFTWAQLLSGRRPVASADRRTDFQRQFAGKTPAEMGVKKNIDIITGATFSTNGIVAAINDAAKKLPPE